MKLSKTLQKKLDRRIVLKHSFDSDGDDTGLKEITSLSAELTKEFLPIVEKLCSAGMVAFILDVDNDETVKQLENIRNPSILFGMPDDVVDVGMIGIRYHIARVGTKKPEPKPEPILVVAGNREIN